MNEYGNFIRRADLIKNLIARQKLDEETATTKPNKALLEANKQRWLKYQELQRHKITAQVAAANSTGGPPASTPTYPSSLKLFIDAGNPLSYPGTGTSVLDLTTNHNNGTLINGVGYTSSNNGALVFDGVNDYVNLGTNLFNYTDISISYWVNLSSYAHGSPFQSFNYNNSGNYFGFQILILTGHQYIAFYNGTPSTGPTIYSPTQLELNKYYRITFTKQASGNIKLYINGILDSTTSTTYNPVYHPTHNYSTIGCQSGNGNLSYFMNGKLAGLKVSNSVWTASDALGDFNEFKSRYGY